MKPCLQNRKPIVWLALGALDPEAARNLQAHLETCPGCRQYWEETVAVKAKLTTVEQRLDLEASESFHRRFVNRLRAAPSRSPWITVAARWQESLLNWRVALPVIGAMALLLVMLPSVLPPLEKDTSTRTRIQAVRPAKVTSDLPPTIANYQLIASQSLEKLDDLLTRQGNRNLARAPIYTASTLPFADSSN